MDSLELFVNNMDIADITKKTYIYKLHGAGILDSDNPDDIREKIRGKSAHIKVSILGVLKKLYPTLQVDFDEARVLVNNMPSKILPSFLSRKEMNKIIKDFPLEYQFLFQLLLNHPVLRATDYYNLTKDNVYRGTLTFSELVKVKGISPKFKLTKQESALWKKVRVNVENKIFPISHGHFDKMTILYCRELGLKSGGISQFRKLYSVEHPEDIEAARRVHERAQKQNHSATTYLSYYS